MCVWREIVITMCTKKSIASDVMSAGAFLHCEDRGITYGVLAWVGIQVLVVEHAMSAVVQVLSEEDADRVNAAVKGVEVFVDTLMLVTGTQNELSKGSGAGEAPAADSDSPAEPMNVDDAPPAQVCRGFVDTCMNMYQCHGPVHHLSHHQRLHLETIYQCS